MAAFLIQTAQLQKTYTKRSADRLVYSDLSIPRGGVIAIVGKSGTGKTTLLNLLGGLDVPDFPEGEDSPPSIELDLGDGPPVDIVKYPDAYPRSQVGYIFQAGYLLLNTTIGLNVALPAVQMGRELYRRHLEETFGRLELVPEFIDRRAWQLSGGQGQRVAFARAVSHDPKLILADEPTSSLDYRLGIELIEWLKGWCKDDPERTVLWVTHDLHKASTLADGLIVLRTDGQSLPYPVKNPGQTELIEKWVYGDEHIPPDAERFTGGSSQSAASESASMREEEADPAKAVDVLGKQKTDWRARLFKAKAVAQVACAEAFNRHQALNDQTLSAPLNARLSLAHTNPGPAAGKLRWKDLLRSFGQWHYVVIIALTALLALIGSLSWATMDQHFQRSVNDPRNCHILVTGRINDDNLSGQEIQKLSQRPWEDKPDDAQAHSGDAFDAVTSCVSGPAAFGRRDARYWDIVVARDGQCLSSGGDTIRLLIAEPNEPVLQKVFLLDRQSGQPPHSLDSFFREVHLFPQTDEIYLTQDIAKALTKGASMASLEHVCLIDYNKGWIVPFNVKGIVDHLPSGRRHIFHAYITEEAYQGMVNYLEEKGYSLFKGFTDIAVYFSSADTDRLQSHLDEKKLVYIEDNIKKIKRLLESSFMFKAILVTVMGAIGFLLILFIAMSVHSYLLLNAKSFAVLKSFGVNRRFITGILATQYGIGWLLSSLVLILITVLISVVVRPWVVSITGLDALTNGVIWISFGISIIFVIFLGLFVSWLVVRRWWKKNQYVAPILQST